MGQTLSSGLLLFKFPDSGNKCMKDVTSEKIITIDLIYRIN